MDCCDGAGEHLASVAQHDDHVRSELFECIGDAEHGSADRAGLVGASVTGAEVSNPGDHGHAVRLDLLDCEPELGLQVHRGDDKAKLQAGVLAHTAQRLGEQPVIGPRPRDVGDPPGHSISIVITEPAVMAVRALRPTTESRRPGGSPVPGRLTDSISRPMTVPAGMSTGATRLLRATGAVSASSGKGRFTPSPRAASTSRMPVTRVRNSPGSREAA